VWRANFFARKEVRRIAKLIEEKANGSAVIQTLLYEIPGILPATSDSGEIARFRQSQNPQKNRFNPANNLQPF
jgi:hypothetical protein